MFKLDLKSRRTRDQIANIPWITDKAREFQENIYFCFIDYAKDWLGGSQPTVENSSRDVNTRPPDLPLEKCRSRNNRTRHGKMDWFQIGKGVHQGCELSACLFNLYAEYICEMLGWMNHKLESRLPGKTSITSDMQMIASLWQKAKSNQRVS